MNTNQQLWQYHRGNILSAGLVSMALCLALLLGAGTTYKAGNHWLYLFRPAAQVLAVGGNPYYAEGAVFNPPWLIALLVPLTWLPPMVGQVGLTLATLVGMYVAARHFGASRLVAAMCLLLPGMLKQYMSVNFDWMAPIGLLLPAPLGLFLVLVKPQLGIGIAAYWLAWAFRRGGLVGVALTFAPVTLAGLISLALYGPWWSTMHTTARLAVVPWNAVLFPWSVPIGLLLLWVAIRRRFPGLALFGGALLSPYMAFYSWIAATVGLLGERWRAMLVLAVMVVVGVNFWG